MGKLVITANDTDKRAAWLADPRLMLAELRANADFVAENPACALMITPATWTIYASVFAAVLSGLSTPPELSEAEIAAFAAEFRHFNTGGGRCA